MSTPISARMFCAVRVSIPSTAAQQLNRRLERAQLFLDRVREPLDLLIEEVQVSEDR